jgi:hypothetical protein
MTQLLTIAQIEALRDAATPGRRVQYHPKYCPEAKDVHFPDWDMSHDMSVILPTGARYRLAEYRHANDAALSQAAPDIAATAIDALTKLAAAEARIAELEAGIHEASDPDFLYGAMDNVSDMGVTLTDFATAASRAIRAALEPMP